MRYVIICFFLGLCVKGFAQNDITPSQKLEGLSHPESVIIDKELQVLYVSNMAGKKEKDGFISKVSTTGKILDTLWVGGLNDPKGLLLSENRLWVTDVTLLIEIERKTGKILKRIPVKNAESLNDITADADGNMFISDLAGNRIYKMDRSGKISEWLHSSKLERPNGLLISGNQLYVASWGKEEPGNFLKVDPETKEIQKITTTGIGNLDGIQAITPESFYVSDWATGNIYRIHTNGDTKKVVESAKSSGDILFLKDSAQLVLPMNHQNALWWYPTE